MTQVKSSNSHKRNGILAAGCVAIVAGMGGLAYAAVPLYQLFCQVTGYGGTTKRAEAPNGTIGTKKFTVRFDANVNRDLGWSFKPAQRKLELKAGEQVLAHYEATNRSGKTSIGTSTFNVTPLEAGAYFNKVECFCFTEQSLTANQAISMPVTFFIDPDIENDPNLKSVSTITLSYTFFPVKSNKTADLDAGKQDNRTVN